MWITKLKLRHEDCPIVTRCQKFHLIVYSYPSTWYEEKKKKFATTRMYDLGSGEEWSRDWLNLTRVGSIIETEGIEGYKKMINTGTWPV
ncbi:TPA: hypothetical protein HA235_02975 [Candidatus Woesearchaeota archaeon]|nr:hypothetical protein [Candidatus Woesearchaeota archaeon]HIH31646.1 hypothetical protein [Candidatus Woesearchaeota archaeon]HIH55425.1 hypothetical protein [Candidatus Woesearchaeota archaeon]HIJ02051.1 hypothetical protein [Candidatus Woesearchaeota archaeon]HIJ14616.1 hypothetical protein [Candidatus Woesearchaeota archaeon]